MINSLHIYTKSFPFGKGESFLENEIEILALNFNKVIIFPQKFDQELLRKLPTNVEVVKVDFANVNISKFNLQNLIRFTSIYAIEYFKSNNRSKYIINFNRYKSILFQQIKRASVLKKYITKNKALHYSYWTEDWAISLSILKKDGIINNLVSRVHGYDLYFERRKDGIQPFRMFQLKWIDKIVAVSNYGLDYLKINHPKFSYKFSCFPLGIKNNGFSPFNSEGVFTIVSCSNVIPLKRVTLIPEILKKMSFQIRWVHFGGGVDFNLLKEKCESLPKNIIYELKGVVNNYEIIQFYKENHVNVFLHLSETEGGIPVSIQEASSFGIPSIATNVGGIPEIVNENLGKLISKNFTIKDISDLITQFEASEKNTSKFRKVVRANCLSNYLYTDRHKRFVEDILVG